MKPIMRALALSAALVLPLAGCSTTSGVSTHGYQDPTVTNTVYEAERGQPLARPRADHVSLRGDTSKRLLTLGQEYFADQNYGLAEKHFRQAVELRADNASAWAGLAASLDQLGRFEFADRAYSHLKEIKGNDPRILNNMGYSHLLRGDYKNARRLFNRAQKMDPTLEEVQGNLHLLEKITEA